MKYLFGSVYYNCAVAPRPLALYRAKTLADLPLGLVNK
jgi:hypothetical protein